MNYFEILIAIVFFCLGFRLVTDEGMALDFIRNLLLKTYKIKDHIKPEIGYAQMKIYKQDNNAELPVDVEDIGNGIIYDPFEMLYYRWVVKNYFPRFISKPICLCISCMASVWGTLIYYVATNYGQDFNLFKWIGLCVSASFIQTFIWNLYIKLLR